MKPSDMQFTGPREAPNDLPCPRSEIADTQTTIEEALSADDAVCCWQNGGIKPDPISNDVERRVYFCSIGRQYWRYGKLGSGLLKLSPLKYRYRSVLSDIT